MQFAADLLDRFDGQRILVIGDVMLDRYIWGAVDRVSPEAPVQILRVKDETWTAGGAGNTARNVVALGGEAAVLGLLGDDPAGERARACLHAEGIAFCGVSGGRQTTVKTRILARNQQLMRIDREEEAPLGEGTEGELIEQVRALADRFEMVIVSDYAKGVVTPGLMAEVIERFGFVTVDPVPRHIGRYRGVTLLTPNHVEASAAAGMPEESEADLIRIGARLVQRTQANVLITRGEKGMALFPLDAEPVFVPTDAQEVIDAVGAGDTVISAMTLALAAGATYAQAVRLANLAAGIVVAKVGTATVTRDEIRERLNRSEQG